MATHGERIKEVETRVQQLKDSDKEQWQHINDKLPAKIKESRVESEKYTDNKVASQGNAILVKFMGVVGGLIVIQTLVQAYWGSGG